MPTTKTVINIMMSSSYVVLSIRKDYQSLVGYLSAPNGATTSPLKFPRVLKLKRILNQMNVIRSSVSRTKNLGATMRQGFLYSRQEV